MIYGIGYTGRKPQELLDIVGRGWLIDVRYSASSMNPDWSAKRLSERHGRRYIHLGEWGNRNFRTPEKSVEIVDFGVGFRMIELLLNGDEDVFLLCACKDATTCHRTHLLETLSQLDYHVQEWDDNLSLPF